MLPTPGGCRHQGSSLRTLVGRCDIDFHNTSRL
jgi:hypothetical protein